MATFYVLYGWQNLPEMAESRGWDKFNTGRETC